MVRAITPEFVVNTLWEAWQNDPDVTMLANGNVVVVWDSFNSDLDVQYVAGQIFSPTGARIGREMVLSDPNLVGNHARVDALDNGGFAVAWESTPDSVLDRSDILTATYGAGGAITSPIRRVNLLTDDSYFAPEVVSRPGGHAVLWSKWQADPGENPFNGEDSFFRAYGPGGAATLPFQINQRQLYEQHNVRAERLTNGNTIVVWESEYPGSSPYALPTDVRARIIAPNGQPVTPEFAIAPEGNGPTGGIAVTDADHSVTALSGGRFVVTWVDTVLDGFPDGDTAFRLYARIFDGAGRAQGATLHVNTFDAREIPDHSNVAALDGGGFVVVWDQWSDVAAGSHQKDVYGQTFSEYGVRVGGNFRVNQETEEMQEWASVTGLKTGGFFVTYKSEYLDGDDDGIAGRVFSGLTRAEASLGGRPVASSRADALNGTARADVMNGLDGNDTLRGGGGNDAMIGARGNDRLSGEAGNDRLAGGMGADWLAGGAGADSFVFGFIAESGVAPAGRDRVLDFAGPDRIDLSGIDAATAAAGNQAFGFIGGTAFSGRSGQLRAELRADGTHVLGDVNGDRKADFDIWLDDRIAMNAGDFIL
ncbi:hypothetical protein [Paracoccus sp. (in: a-proteobacteria)]|uniref:hypothetical protein n=1 Tax=Paracoccus sp. TaxID=267 RepID=UPI0035B10068